MDIRDATPGDVGELLAMVKELAEFEGLLHCVTATEEVLAASLFGDERHAFALVGEEGGAAVAMVIYFHNFSTFIGRYGIYIEDIYVRTSARGKGYGTQLIREVCRRAVAKGCGRVEWWCLNWNARAIDFYRKLGATPMSEWTVHRLTRQAFEAVAAGDVP
jgi:GNAT superfamily N-acetyltransferase